MKKYYQLTLVLLTALTINAGTTGLQAQSTKSIHTNSGQMTLSGTSTLHDWTMNGVFQVEGDFKLAENSRAPQSLSKLKFLLPVENLKSDKKKLDETAYKALKTDQHKEIHFSMTSATIKELGRNQYAITALGNLTIAGVTRPITMNVSWVINDDQTITCTGIQKLRMTDFDVQPPRFLGLMKTGDEISLDFSFQIKS